MKKLAANYVVAESGEFLKNGLLIVEDDGTVLEYIDTHGQLEEMAQLVFHNGILIPSFQFKRMHSSVTYSDFDSRLSSSLLAGMEGKQEISLAEWLGTCKKVQEYFPDMPVTEIFRMVTDLFIAEGGFQKEISPGIYLLTGSDLGILKLTPNTRLKRIL